MLSDVFHYDFKKKNAWKQFQNKLYIMNLINNGENIKLSCEDTVLSLYGQSVKLCGASPDGH